MGLLVVASVLFNLQLHDLGRPPNNWVSNFKASCPQIESQFLGLRASFLETSTLICIPIMVFASAFAVTIDSDMLYWSNTRSLVITRLIVGFFISGLIDLSFSGISVQATLSSAYFLNYILRLVLSTFVMYGLTPPLAAAICSSFDKVDPDEDAFRKRRVFQSETTSSSELSEHRAREPSGSETLKQKSSSTSKH